MLCSKCAAPLPPNSAFCPGCGTPVASAANLPAVVKRPAIITLLAVLQWLGAAFWLLIAAGQLMFVPAPANPTEAAVGMFVGVFFAVLSALQILCGVGLWNLRPWGRTMQLAFAWIGLLGIPIGTLIAIAILVYLMKPGIKVLFSGRPASALSPDELTQIALLQQTSSSKVVVVAAVIVVLVLMIPIVAAIAIPGLLRARMTGNEVSALARLRTITSAQVAYAATCGNGHFADSFVTLADPAQPDSFPQTRLDNRSGYQFTLGPGSGAVVGPTDCRGNPTVTAWYATATPQSFGSTGARSFAANGTDGIWESDNAAPPSEPFGPPAVRR
jgi:hypothetical protein